MAWLLIELICMGILLVCVGFIAYWVMAWIKGDCVLRLQTDKMSAVKAEEMSLDRVTLTYTVPIVNVGKQIGTIMDAFVRVYLPREQFDQVKAVAFLTAADDPRDDGYWPAFIMEVGKPKYFLIKLILTGKTGNILRDVENIPPIPMDIVYQAVGRSDYYYDKKRMVITEEDIRRALYQYTTEAGKI